MTAATSTRAPRAATTVVRCNNLVHVFGSPAAPETQVAALRGVDLVVRTGEMVALLGPSGAGKSTLLWHLAGLLRPTAGSVEVNGHEVASMTAPQLAAFRLREVGVVLQGSARNLLPYLSAVDNVLHAQQPLGKSGRRRRLAPGTLLDAMGIGGLGARPAGRLSGGEQQRLALAVALANSPAVLLADEPTSQLDAVSAAAVVDLLKDVNRRFETTVVIVTHDPAVGTAFPRTVTIRDGRVGAEGRDGADYVVVGRDGTLQVPPDLADALPPGSLARAERTATGIALHRVDDDERAARAVQDDGSGTDERAGER